MVNTKQKPAETPSENSQNVNPSGQTVTMTLGQLEAIIDSRIKNRGVPQKPKRVTERIARIRIHEGQPVVWYGNVRSKKDIENGEKILMMDIKCGEAQTKYTVPYLEFLNTPNSVQVQIKVMDVKEVEKSEGTVMAENPDPVHDKKFRPQEVEATVVTQERTATVIVLDGDLKGQEFVIPDAALNPAA